MSDNKETTSKIETFSEFLTVTIFLRRIFVEELIFDVSHHKK